VTSADSSRLAADRVWAALPPTARSVLEEGLSPTDLQTLLLDLVRTRSARIDPPRLRQRWAEDQFVRPADVDPRRLADLLARVWSLLPAEFAGIELSPVTPLGSCSAVAPVDQNWIVSTIRGSEVISDPTNVLVLEADRRRRSTRDDVHLAAHSRVLRAQRFPPGFSAHFALLALVSGGRDRGSSATELDFLRKHLTAWRTVLDGTLGPGRHSAAWAQRQGALPDLVCGHRAVAWVAALIQRGSVSAGRHRACRPTCPEWTPSRTGQGRPAGLAPPPPSMLLSRSVSMLPVPPPWLLPVSRLER
jgi:hypothetical protein